MNRWLERSRAALATQPGMHRQRLLLYGGVVVGLFAFLFLLGGSPVADGPSTPLISLGDVMVRLGIVLAIAYASLLALRAYVGGRGGTAVNHDAIRVQERCRLGPQQTLYLVTVEGRALLLGATATSIATLAELGPAERYQTPVNPGEVPFADHLRSLGLGDHTSAGEGRFEDGR